MNTSDTHDRIAASIDWQPTCLPGAEQRTIVRQVLDAAAILDGASAAPDPSEPAPPVDVPDIRLTPGGSLWRRLGTHWALQMSSGAHHPAPPADAVRLAAATPAPPVDAAARLHAAADAGDAAATHDYGAHTVRDTLREAAGFLTVWPESPVAQAIARALTATPTEERH